MRMRRIASALTPTLRPSAGTTDWSALAEGVIRGDYGNGETRKSMLGDRYARVQEIVNQKLNAALTLRL